MGRSPILAGKWDARDRAKQRRRFDRTSASESDASDAMWAWLADSEFRKGSRAEPYAIDLSDYLQRTSRIDIPSAERLRFLAIQLEETCHWLDVGMVDRVYAEVLRLDPDSAVGWHSRGIFIKSAAIVALRESSRERLARTSLEYLSRARELDRHDPGIAYSIGKWHYQLGAGGTDAAPWFDATLEMDPKHAWGLLYRAHCLQDAEAWTAAAEAYDAVPLAEFTGPRDWMVDLIHELRAYCLLNAGDTDAARALFEKVLTRFEREPERTRYYPFPHLPDVCSGRLEAELGERFSAISQAGLDSALS